MSPVQELLDLAARSPLAEVWWTLCHQVEALADASSVERDLEALDEALSPWPDALRIAPPGWIERLCEGERVPEIRLARAVALSYFDADELLSVTRAPHLEHITHLDLTSASLDEGSGPLLIRLLDEASSLGAVTSLNLKRCHLGDAGAEALSRSSLLERLTSLDLSWNEITSDGIAALAGSPRVRRLRRLSLDYNEDEDESAARALGASPHLTDLEELGFELSDYQSLTACQHLARSPYLCPAIRERYKTQAQRLLFAEARKPSPEGYRERIAPLLDAFEASDFDSGRLAEVTALLAAWPPGRRPLSSIWLDRVLRREEVPQTRNADVLDVHRLRGSGRRAEDVDTIAELLDAPELAHITSIDLFCCVFSQSGLRRLFSHPSVRRVRALSLTHVHIGPRLIRALAASLLGAGLCSLSVTIGFKGLSTLRALFQSSLMTRITSLGLACNELGDAGAAAIARQPSLAHLSTLDLRDNGIGDRGAVAIARSPHARGLRELLLSENNIGDEGATAIAGSPYLMDLIKLDLGYGDNHIGDAGATALARSTTLGHLVELRLGFNQVGGEGALALVRSDRLKSLRRLHICYGNAISDESAAAMAEAAPLVPALRLDLGFGAAIGKPGIAALDRTTLVDPVDRLERQALSDDEEPPA